MFVVSYRGMVVAMIACSSVLGFAVGNSKHAVGTVLDRRSPY